MPLDGDRPKKNNPKSRLKNNVPRDPLTGRAMSRQEAQRRAREIRRNESIKVNLTSQKNLSTKELASLGLEPEETKVTLLSDKNLTQAEKKSLGISNKSLERIGKVLRRAGIIGTGLGMLSQTGSAPSWQEMERREEEKRRNKCPYDKTMAPYRGGAPRRCGGRSAESRGPTKFYDTPRQFRLSAVPSFLREVDRLRQSEGFSTLTPVEGYKQAQQRTAEVWKERGWL